MESQKKQISGFVLFVLLLTVYLLTYRGEAFSKDTIFIFDSMESLVRRGDMTRNYGLFESGLFAAPPEGELPFPPPNQEPLGIILPAPLFFIAQYLPRVGIMHLVWFFNIFIMAFTALNFYVIALQQKYSIKTAWIGALLFGIGTIAWWYSRLLFRETSMALFVLWAFTAAMTIHTSWEHNKIEWRAIILFIIAITAALLTKSIAIFLLPGLALIMMPPLSLIIKRWRLVAGMALAGTITLLLIYMLMNDSSIARRYDPANFNRLSTINWEFILESILGYHIGVSRSVWLYSPVLFIGMWGAWLLIKRGQWRLVAAPLISIFLFSVWYGISLRLDWPGGWGWGPRYMLPIIPMLMFWLLPALDYTFTEGGRWAKSAVLFFAGSGIFIQLLGMGVPLSNYYTDLFRADKIYDYSRYDESLWHWMDGNWQLDWSPIYYHINRFDIDYIDMGWRYANPRGLTVAIIMLLLGFSLFMSRYIFKGQLNIKLNYGYIATAILLIPTIIITGLISLQKDPRYIQGRMDLYNLAMTLDDITDDDDIIFLDRFEYRPIFMNYFKTQAIVATLPYSPAEKYGSETPPVGLDDPIGEQIGHYAAYALDWASGQHDDLWLIASTSPFDAERRRPVERYLATHYFQVSEIAGENNLRAIRFLTEVAPLEPASIITTGAVFNDFIQLNGFDLPRGTVFSAGQVLPISLVWQPVNTIDRDYTVGIYLIGSNDVIYAQRDGLPQATFGQMSTWQINTIYYDNHGLLLPDDLPSGDYTLAIALYHWQDRQRLNITSANNDNPDNALNLTTITIQ